MCGTTGDLHIELRRVVMIEIDGSEGIGNWGS